MKSDFSIIDLSKLPPPKVMEEKSPELIKAELVAQIEREMGPDFKLLDSDPMARLIEVFAYREALLVQRMNYAASQCMLAFASDSALENLVSLLGVKKEATDTDETLRKKAIASLDRLSTAGSFAGYRFHALELGSDFLLDANPFSDADGVVKIALLFKDEYYSDEKLIKKRPELLAGLRERIEKYRPLTDRLELLEAVFVDFKLEAKLVLGHGADSQKILEAARLGAERYLQDIKRIGRTVPLSALYAALHSGGQSVIESVISSPSKEVVPADTKALSYSVPRCLAIKLDIGA